MKKILLITIFSLVLFGCEKYEEDYEDITISKNLSFEYASEINDKKLLTINKTENSKGKVIGADKKIDTYKLGKQKIKIDYLNNKGKKKFAYVTVDIVDTTKPIILSGNSFSTYLGEEINIVSRTICADNYDKKPNCYIDGDYNINKLGSYNLKYIAVDSSNNKTQKDIKLTVKEKPKYSSNNSNNNNDYERLQFIDAVKMYKTNNTKIGIDVSAWQDEIDWEKVSKAGCEFAILRVGFGHTLKNELVLDKRFKENLENAKKYNIPLGIYFYSYAGNIEQVKEQVKFILKELDGTKLDLPIAFDWEDWQDFNSYNMSLTDINLVAKTFIEEVEKAGYKASIYSSKYYLENIWNIKNEKVWLAHYTEKTNYNKPYYMWQFTNIGKIDGIKTDVDINVLYE